MNNKTKREQALIERLRAWAFEDKTWDGKPVHLSELAVCAMAALRCLDRVEVLLANDAQDAARWRKLMACERIRVLGSARLGQPDAYLGVELWGVYPGEHPDGAPTLTAFVDGLALRGADGGR